MSSVYSLAQIIGGLVLGALSDRIMSRRSVLLLSFLGSALSYGAIGLSSSFSMLVAGRVVVGLVKQVRAVLRSGQQRGRWRWLFFGLCSMR